MTNTKLNKTQYGYIAQQLKKAFESHTDRKATEEENRLITDIGFFLVEGIKNSNAGIENFKHKIDTVEEERKQALIIKLEKELKELRGGD